MKTVAREVACREEVSTGLTERVLDPDAVNRLAVLQSMRISCGGCWAPTPAAWKTTGLFEYEWETEWFLTRPGGGLQAYRKLFDPVTHEDASPADLFAPLDEIVRVINGTPDDRFEAAVGEYIDLNLFIRQVAAQNFIAQGDGILGYAGFNNFYLYRFENSPRSQLS